ncbi:MAG TPA: SDR family NAD(P)-dependent oxidoreductase, partial [Acidimicrobiales bacterium]|nr:SDR family NAD(P)-dependent oxidoreductase [Acidimicrobiales bacterium]
MALVTGGSRGIGAAVAERLAAEGADVAVAYATRAEAAEAVAARVRDLGRRAVTLGGDLADPGVAASLVRGTEEGLGPVDVLVANAGPTWRPSTSRTGTTPSPSTSGRPSCWPRRSPRAWPGGGSGGSCWCPR